VLKFHRGFFLKQTGVIKMLGRKDARKRIEAAHTRAKIKELMQEGLKASAIAKLTGISYKHVKSIFDQEKQIRI
jgi:hypothetical protein